MTRAHTITGPALAVILGLAAALAAFGQASAQDSAENPPEALETALVDYMDTELDGASTGMDCETALSEGAQPGNWCWEIQELSGDTAEVRFGPLQSEFMESATFVRGDDGWSVQSTAPEPPNTGTGTMAESNGTTPLEAATVVTVFAGLAVAGATLFGWGRQRG